MDRIFLLLCRVRGYLYLQVTCQLTTCLSGIDNFIVVVSIEWNLIKEPAQAAKVFKENLLREHASGKPLRMKMDVRDSEEERERELLLFYKQQQEWACPVHCTLFGK